MLRRAVTFAALALALSAPAVAVAKTPAAGLLECKGSGAAGETRSATFLGRMLAIPATDNMMMRFTLLEQFGDQKLHPVTSPELRAWRPSKPGVQEFRYKQTVTALQGGGEYRMRVDFRWLDIAGNLLQKAQRLTPPCVQKGDLPNLKIGEPRAQAGPGGTAVYIVPVYNEGEVAGDNVAVELFVDGAATNVGHIDSIPPGQSREVRFTGPICKRRLRVVADPLNSLKEALESDNAINVDCPPLSG
jgi:hypothetical protein